MADAVQSRLPTLFDIRKERYRRSFYEFVRDFWGVVEPAIQFQDAPHIKALCEHFEAVIDGRISKLNVEIAPGTAKSMLISVIGPAWVWGPRGMPWFRFISSTQSHDLTIRDSLRFRALVYSPEYQSFWASTVVPMADNNKQHYIENTAKGFRISTSVTGKVTGHRGHLTITDDTLDATDALSDAKRAQVHSHLRALSNRVVNPKKRRWINIGQRLHEEDAGGWCHDHNFETLCLPTEFDPARACTTSIGFRDWRHTKGEFLVPFLFSEEEAAQAKLDLGTYGYSAQHQQLPVPAGGGILKNVWWLDYNYAERPPFHTVIQFWDTAFTSNEANDSSAVATWGIGTAGAYLLDAKSFHLEMPDLLKQMKTEAAKWSPRQVMIESKANALSLEQTLRRDAEWKWKLVLVGVTLNKTQRAHAIAPFVERGLAHVPRNQLFSTDMLNQSDVFPNGKLRDLADAAISALLQVFSTYTFTEAANPAYVDMLPKPPPPPNSDRAFLRPGTMTEKPAQFGERKKTFF